MLTAYFNKINELLTLIEKEEGDRLRQAARKVTEGLQKGGIVQLFGCGHSHILTEEVFLPGRRTRPGEADFDRTAHAS